MISWEIISNITGDPRYRFCEAKCDLFQGHLGYLIIIAFPDPMHVGRGCAQKLVDFGKCASKTNQSKHFHLCAALLRVVSMDRIILLNFIWHNKGGHNIMGLREPPSTPRYGVMGKFL